MSQETVHFTQDQLLEVVRMAVQEALTAQALTSPNHLREFVGEDGEAWLSFVVPKKLAIRKVVATLATGLTILLGAITFVNKWVMIPIVREVAQVEVNKLHDEIVLGYATKPTLETHLETDTQRWYDHDQREKERSELLSEMRNDIKSLLKGK